MPTQVVPDPWSQCLAAVAELGSRAHFIRIYEHFGPRLKAHLIIQGCEDSTAEELVQETMLAVWRKAGQFRPERGAASTWIYRIARNLRVDRLRRDAGRSEQAAEPEPVLEPADVRLDSEPLREAIRDLPMLQAQTVYKSYFLGQSHSEIAADLDLPLGTVKSNLRLAFRALRRSLGVTQ